MRKIAGASSSPQRIGGAGSIIEDGGDVRSYHARRLLGNFEWSEGYRRFGLTCFGLTYMDFAWGNRPPPVESGRWYGGNAAENGVEN